MTQRKSSGRNGSDRATFAITNLIKLAGLVIAVHEAFSARDPVVFATASFMLAGAQASESALLGRKGG